MIFPANNMKPKIGFNIFVMQIRKASKDPDKRETYYNLINNEVSI